MKNIMVLVVLGLLFSKSYADGNGHEINIKVNGLKDSVCYLAGYYGKKQYYKDTSRFDSKGICTFKGKEELPGGIYSIILPGNKYFEFIINEQEFTLETDTINFVKNMKVKGSVENKLFYEHFNLVANLQKDAEKYKKMLSKLEEWGNNDSIAIIRKKLKKINSQVEDYKLGLIK